MLHCIIFAPLIHTFALISFMNFHFLNLTFTLGWLFRNIKQRFHYKNVNKYLTKTLKT
jgi:hypothetical protein